MVSLGEWGGELLSGQATGLRLLAVFLHSGKLIGRQGADCRLRLCSRRRRRFFLGGGREIEGADSEWTNRCHLSLRERGGVARLGIIRGSVEGARATGE